LQPELQNARVEGGSELTEVLVGKVVADPVELGVIPHVEGLNAEFQSAAPSLAKDETLEQREVPVVAGRTTYSVVAEIAERTERRQSKGRRIEVLNVMVARQDLVRIGDLADEIGAILGVRQTVAALRSAGTDVDRHTGFDGHDARNAPSASYRLHEPAGAVPEDRDVVDEVEGGVMSAIETAGTDIIPPAEVRV